MFYPYVPAVAAVPTLLPRDHRAPGGPEAPGPEISCCCFSFFRSSTAEGWADGRSSNYPALCSSGFRNRKKVVGNVRSWEFPVTNQPSVTNPTPASTTLRHAYLVFPGPLEAGVRKKKKQVTAEPCDQGVGACVCVQAWEYAGFRECLQDGSEYKSLMYPFAPIPCHHCHARSPHARGCEWKCCNVCWTKKRAQPQPVLAGHTCAGQLSGWPRE